MIDGRAVSKMNLKRVGARLIALGPILALAGCLGLGGSGTTPDSVVSRSDTRESAAVIGEGETTVAMLLPLSAGGSTSGLAQSFQNAAELAMDEVATDHIRIELRDTAGEEATARRAAETAVSGDARLILGPVFAPAVRGAGKAARSANVPMIAFSTDSSVAGRGVYLLSFLPRQDATRIVSFAASEGLEAFAALVPDNGYGLVTEAAFREAVSTNGGRTVAVQRYEPGKIDAAVDALSSRGAFEALFVPNGGDDPAAAASALSRAGIEAQLLGSGQWANKSVASGSGVAGAWYPAPAGDGYNAFAERYENRFGAAPPRTASLVYDAVLLANGLVGARGDQAFTRQSLEASDGFLGLDGIFRLTREGLSERGLAVYEIGPEGGTRIVSPAPDKFRQSF